MVKIQFVHTSDWHLGYTQYNKIERNRDFKDAALKLVDKDNIFESSKGQLIIATNREEFGRNAKNTIHINVRGNQREVIA